MIGEKPLCQAAWGARGEPGDGDVWPVGAVFGGKAGGLEGFCEVGMELQQWFARLDASPEHTRLSLQWKPAHATNREGKRLKGDCSDGLVQRVQTGVIDLIEEVQCQVELVFPCRPQPICRLRPDKSQPLPV